MSELVIKHLSAEAHELLKKRAAKHGRSLSKEAAAILESAVHVRPSLEEIDALRVRGAAPLNNRLLTRAKIMGRP